MLTFRNTSLGMAVAATLLFLTGFFVSVPWFAYVGLAFIYSLFLFFGSYRVDSDFYMPVICSGRTTEKKVALSFDDGPAPEHTAAILAILNSHGIKAAFFCIGKKIPGRENILKEAMQSGHLIANHSNSHAKLFDFFSADKMYDDLLDANRQIENAIGKVPKLFRPPYGVTNPNLRKATEKAGYIAVGWNVRSYDTVIKDERKLLKRVTEAIRPGAVFLFHDTCQSTVSILPDFLNELKNRGYAVERIDQLLNVPAYA